MRNITSVFVAIVVLAIFTMNGYAKDNSGFERTYFTAKKELLETFKASCEIAKKDYEHLYYDGKVEQYLFEELFNQLYPFKASQFTVDFVDCNELEANIMRNGVVNFPFALLGAEIENGNAKSMKMEFKQCALDVTNESGDVYVDAMCPGGSTARLRVGHGGLPELLRLNIGSREGKDLDLIGELLKTAYKNSDNECSLDEFFIWQIVDVLIGAKSDNISKVKKGSIFSILQIFDPRTYKLN